MKRPNMKGEPPDLIDAFVLRGRMIAELAHKSAREKLRADRLQRELHDAKLTIRRMAGHR